MGEAVGILSQLDEKETKLVYVQRTVTVRIMRREKLSKPGHTNKIIVVPHGERFRTEHVLHSVVP